MSAETAQATLSLSKPASDMLLAMCEYQFNALIDYVEPNEGPVALLQACRELDEIAALVGDMHGESGFEDEARAMLDWMDECAASAERTRVEDPS